MHLPHQTLKVLLAKWRHFVTSHDGVMSCHDITPSAKVLYHALQIRTKLSRVTLKSQFLIGWPWPMTSTIKRDLDMVQVDIHVKFHVRTSNGSVLRVHIVTHTKTHAYTDRTDFITSTADPGGKNCYIDTQLTQIVTTENTGLSQYVFYFIVEVHPQKQVLALPRLMWQQVPALDMQLRGLFLLLQFILLVRRLLQKVQLLRKLSSFKKNSN